MDHWRGREVSTWGNGVPLGLGLLGKLDEMGYHRITLYLRVMVRLDKSKWEDIGNSMYIDCYGNPLTGGTIGTGR